MKPRIPHSPDYAWRQAQRLLILAVCSLGLLSACVAQTPPYSADVMQPPSDGSTSPSSSTPAPATNAAQASPSPSETAQFNFPLTTCGEQSSEPSATWYTVYIDNGDVSQVRSRYCGDAISTTRAKSGTPTVQVASFTSYAKALTLAKAVGGVVEQVEQTAQAAPDSGSSYQNAESPAAAQAPTAPAASTTSGMQVGQTAYLSASDPGTPINVRGNAGTDANVQTTGMSGDRVQIANRAQGNDGFTWYQVRLDSGTTGWVRSDLIAAQAPTAQAPTIDRSADQSSQAQAPSQAPQTPYAQAPQAPSYDQSQVQPPPAQPPYAQSPYGQAPYGQSPYAQAPYGQPSYGQPQPPYAQAPYGAPYSRNRNSTLTANDPGAAINIREFASPKSRIRYYANPGDPVQISGSAQGDDGFTWYQVRFPSGAAGWVRSDLITAN